MFSPVRAFKSPASVGTVNPVNKLTGGAGRVGTPRRRPPPPNAVHLGVFVQLQLGSGGTRGTEGGGVYS